MPDLKLYHPGHFPDAEAKRDAIAQMRAAVSQHLECLNPRGDLVVIQSRHVNVRLISYQDEDVQLSTPFIVELAAYGYPTRMDNIKDRLETIRRSFASILDVRQADVSVTFTPIPEGCWV